MIKKEKRSDLQAELLAEMEYVRKYETKQKDLETCTNKPGMIPLEIREILGKLTGKRFDGYMCKGDEEWHSEIAAITKNFHTLPVKLEQKNEPLKYTSL